MTGLALPKAARILIIKPSSLGDVATALPMLCDLKAAFPNAEIDWLVHPTCADLVRGHDAIRNVIPFDRKGLAHWWFNPRAAGELLALRRTLRQGRYDCVIDAQGLLRSGLLSWLSGASVRIGFASAREGAKWFYTHRVPLPKEPQLAVVRMRELLKPLAINTRQTAEARVFVQPAAVATITQRLGQATHPIVVIPGARRDTKRWPIEGFVTIIKQFQESGQQVVLSGSPGETKLCDAIAEKCGPNIINLGGQTSLAEMVALLASARLVVANDSGPLHVAVALGRPVVAIYGPTDPNFVGPYGQLDRVVRFAVDCQPCSQPTCDHHECMRGGG